MLFFAFLLVALDQTDTGRKDGGKSEKEPTKPRAIAFPNQTSQNGTKSAEQKSDDVFMGLCLFQG
jgi:hypothetical protein